MPFLRLPRFKTRLDWFNDWLETVLRTIERSANIQTTAPLTSRWTPTGLVLGLNPTPQVLAGVTAGSMTSGSYSAPTTVTVSLLSWTTGNAWAAGASPPQVTAYNSMPLTATIPSGRYVVLFFQAGKYHILTGDCS